MEIKWTDKFSEDRTRRLWLECVWNPSLPLLACCLLNPSSAKAGEHDPTTTRIARRAASLGYGGWIIVNGASLIATDPFDLYHHPAPVGPEDDWHIEAAAKVVRKGGRFLCGWGTHMDAVLPGRSDQIMGILGRAGVDPFALHINADGSPKHPLYCSYSALLRQFDNTDPTKATDDDERRRLAFQMEQLSELHAVGEISTKRFNRQYRPLAMRLLGERGYRAAEARMKAGLLA